MLFFQKVEFLNKIIDAISNVIRKADLSPTQQSFLEMEADLANKIRAQFLDALSGAVENYNAAEVTSEGIAESRSQLEINEMLTDKGREQAAELGIDLSKVDWSELDNFNETRYNATGWATVNGIVKYYQMQNFRDRLAELWQISHDKRINTVYVPQDGIYYYFTGAFKRPSIKAIYIINPDLREQLNRNDYPIMERVINANGRKLQFARAYAIIRASLGKRMVDSYDRRNWPSYGQLFQYKNYGELDAQEFDTRLAGQRGSKDYKERSVNDNTILEDEDDPSSFSVRNQIEIYTEADLSLGAD